MMISTAAIVICLIGIVIEFVSKKTWDATGCCILSCNSVILLSYLGEYKNLRQLNNGNTSAE